MSADAQDRHQSPPDKLSVIFLGTAAGVPCLSRNVSCTCLKLDGNVCAIVASSHAKAYMQSGRWVVDAGEASLHQFMRRKTVRIGQIKRIFVTHMHGDHVFGLPSLLSTISAGIGSVLPGADDPRLAEAQKRSPIEIYGPATLRKFIRYNLTFTRSVLSIPYVVHELLFDDDEQDTNQDLHVSELPGRNVRISNGSWSNFLYASGIKVSAGPILHTIPCIGYVFQEGGRMHLDTPTYLPILERNREALLAQGYKDPRTILGRLQRERKPITLPDGTVLEPPQIGPPGRKVVVLGDTYDANAMADLAMRPDLLVHECTNAFLPAHDPSQSTASAESVTAKAREHGHSTPDVVGPFANKVKARCVVLNHLSVKYPDVKDRQSWLDEIGRQVQGHLEGEARVIVARDFLEVEVPRKDKHGRPA